MDIKKIKDICADFALTSRWVQVIGSNQDGQTTSTILRVIGIGRKYVRVMHQDGFVENIVSSKVYTAW